MKIIIIKASFIMILAPVILKKRKGYKE